MGRYGKCPAEQKTKKPPERLFYSAADCRNMTAISDGLSGSSFCDHSYLSWLAVIYTGSPTLVETNRQHPTGIMRCGL